MKKNLIILILIILLCFSIFFNVEREEKKNNNIEIKKEKTLSAPPSIGKKNEIIFNRKNNIENLENFSIVRVVDGDTIKIKNKNNKIFTVRLIGINTPETVHPTKKVECFGKEASAQAKKILNNKKIFFEKDSSSGIDKYGRRLGYVILESGEDFGELMIKNGFAHEYTYNLPYKKQKIYKKAEKKARENKKGLWGDGVCENFSDENYLEDGDVKKGCNIKGNISSSTKEKIYHIPGQRYYSRTKISEEIGEKFFCSEDDAISEGWRKAKV